jgi:two-component system sensor histidine kinase KdpD
LITSRIPLHPGNAATLKKKPNPFAQYGIVLFTISLVGIFCFFLNGVVDYHVVAFLLLVTVSILAMLFDIYPVLFAAILSSFTWDYFFIPPRFTITVGTTEDRFLLLMYFIIAMINAALTYKIRQTEKQSRQKEEKEHILKLYNTLFNSLSHELQTPVSTIIGVTDTLKESSAKLSEQEKGELVDEISTASLRLHKQVENLLNMSRLETGHLQLKRDWCDIHELLYSTVNKFPGRGSDRIRIEMPESFPLFRLDFGIMEQVIYNLVNNALQYTPPGSQITLSARYTTSISGHLDEDGLTGHQDHKSYRLVLLISDQGPGFPEDEIGKVFGKFYRLRNAKPGGTGLGLSIVKGFVEAHQGTIRLRNLPAGGAEFTIDLPAEASYINALKHE